MYSEAIYEKDHWSVLMNVSYTDDICKPETWLQISLDRGQLWPYEWHAFLRLEQCDDKVIFPLDVHHKLQTNNERVNRSFGRCVDGHLGWLQPVAKTGSRGQELHTDSAWKEKHLVLKMAWGLHLRHANSLPGLWFWWQTQISALASRKLVKTKRRL